mgnify:CR=1 FL=1
MTNPPRNIDRRDDGQELIMASDHTSVIKLALMKASALGWRLFQNAMGLGYVGKVIEDYHDAAAGEIVTLSKARRVKFGVCNPGGFDLIGWQTVKITEDMVGMRLAVFVAVDAKTESYKTLSQDQKTFARNLVKAGGVAIIARREGDGVVNFDEVSPEDHHGKN